MNEVASFLNNPIVNTTLSHNPKKTRSKSTPFVVLSDGNLTLNSLHVRNEAEFSTISNVLISLLV